MFIDLPAAGAGGPRNHVQFREAATQWTHLNYRARFRRQRRRTAWKNTPRALLCVNSRSVPERYESRFPVPGVRGSGSVRGIEVFRERRESGLRLIPGPVSIRDAARAGRWRWTVLEDRLPIPSECVNGATKVSPGFCQAGREPAG